MRSWLIYLGSGYRTQIYDYDRSRVEGFPGENIDLRYLEDTSLPHGKVMAFQASKDVHTQFPPDEVSISINLLPVSSKKSSKQQFFFDTEKRCIKKYADDINNRHVTLVMMAGWIHDDNTIDVLLYIAQKHECARTRAAAFASLLEIGRIEEDRWRDLISRDPDPRLERKVNFQREEFR